MVADDFDRAHVTLPTWALDAERRVDAFKPSDDVVTHGLQRGPWGFPRVDGMCPACKSASLFLAVGGHVTCSLIGCPDPTAASDLLRGERAGARE